ncbi:MAG TPA: Ni/Fe-hydrogenase, b-type cytochrome subunit [Geobacteraceae bacterium]|nr:Ni/Fe-hydrogenase, b-type cytochrome subunit [Geobacteraceae bacterium]
MDKSCLYEKYVWEVPVRVTHWVNVLSIITLSVTGIYIGTAKTLAHEPSQFIMGWIRFVHFVAAYAFSISVASRIYWMFAGNKYASWREFVPFLTHEGRQRMFDTLKYYTFIGKKAPHPVGHNTLAGTAYLAVFGLYLIMIGTGFALYSERAPLSLVHKLTWWMFILFSNQGIRLTHHMVMWLLIGFVIHHIYSAWLMDVKERGGVMSSIFSGYKAVKQKD